MMTHEKGKFIVLEGGDGAGKDTQLGVLREHFGTKNFLYTREPGGTALGERLRSVLTEKSDVKICMEAELLLFSASRAQHVRETIRPALDLGVHVICSRFSLSTIAYQLYGRGRMHYLDAFYHIDRFAVGDTKPNLYILLDALGAVGLARQSRLLFERDRIESEEASFRERVAEGYRAALPEYPYGVSIAGDRPRGEVSADVIAVIERCIGGSIAPHDHHLFQTLEEPLVRGFSSEGLTPVW